jgi:hypothetical protein
MLCDSKLRDAALGLAIPFGHSVRDDDERDAGNDRPRMEDGVNRGILRMVPSTLLDGSHSIRKSQNSSDTHLDLYR